MLQPESFTPTRVGRVHRRRFWPLVVWVVFLAVFASLIFAAWFVFTARRLTLAIEPEFDHVSINGSMPAIRVGQTYLLRPGTYQIRGGRQGYHDLVAQIVVSNIDVTFNATLRKLPGELLIHTFHVDEPEKVLAASVFLNEQADPNPTVLPFPLEAGRYKIRIEMDRYVPVESELVIEGMGKRQSVEFAMVPDWAMVKVSTQPVGAAIAIDGMHLGQAPLEVTARSGIRQLVAKLGGYKDLARELVVEPNKPIVIDDINMEVLDGVLQLTTIPPVANILIGEQYRGVSPIEVVLSPGIEHRLYCMLPGYQGVVRNVAVESGKTFPLHIELTAITGDILLVVSPTDSVLVIDGKRFGPTPQMLSLLARPHNLLFQCEGYDPHQVSVTPRAKFSQRLKVELQPIAEKSDRSPDDPARLLLSNGCSLTRITPSDFTMGSSRRQRGRRSNEGVRSVSLTRPFYIGVTEVTNGQFREFEPSHNSGTEDGKSLNGDVHPVANVDWDQAVSYCNWLSQREKLDPYYENQDGRWVVPDALSTSYRLPTEAEWAYCAKFDGTEAGMPFPWGKRYPPKGKAGNYADVAANKIFVKTVEGYDDGHAVVASIKSFAASALGLYDMGGNVAEWCHDYYSIYSHRPGKVYINPMGADRGRHHVIRGASWRSSGIGKLRNAHRDYDDSRRKDLGFRIARYADTSE